MSGDGNGERLELEALTGLPRVEPGDDLAAMLVSALAELEVKPQQGDVVVVAQKVVSRAENRFRRLAEVQPSARAVAVAAACDKDPRLVELVLAESVAVLACAPGVLIVTHRLGHSMANAGIDRSNVAGDEDTVLLLPVDPDGWCRELRGALREAFGVDLGVIVSDSFGRPWRLGTTGVAIGASGVPALLDVRGRANLDGRVLEATQIGLGDEIAAAASLLMGQADEGRPVVLVRGIGERGEGRAADILRPPAVNLFRSTAKDHLS